jgi:hypothetical protein
MIESKLTVSIRCKDAWKNPSFRNKYRLFFNGELLTERTWIWPSNVEIKEEIIVGLHKDIEYKLTLMPISFGEKIPDNFQKGYDYFWENVDISKPTERWQYDWDQIKIPQGDILFSTEFPERFKIKMVSFTINDIAQGTKEFPSVCKEYRENECEITFKLA